MAGDETEYIELKVFDQDNSATHFRMHRTTKMEKLKRSYSETVRVPVTSLTFLFDGQRINDDETPMSFEMVQADVIEVYQESPRFLEHLEEQHRLLMQDKEALKEKLSNVSAELLSSRSDREELEKALEWTKNSLDKVAADVTRVEEARSSLSKNKEELEEEVQNLRPIIAVLNENLTKEMEKSQKDVDCGSFKKRPSKRAERK